MAIELLILGLDGVIFDTEAAHLKASNDAFAECGLGLTWSARQFREAARISGAAGAAAAAAQRIPGATAKDVTRVAAAKVRLFHEAILAEMPELHQGGARLMEEALDAGCKLAVVTDIPAQTASVLLERSFDDDVTNRFDTVIGGAHFSEADGNGPYDMALRTVGIEASCSVAIDASPPALRAAQQAGIWTMAATPYEKDIARISGADLWCPQLQELRDLVDVRKAPRESAGRFITFDILRSLKKGRLHAAVPAVADMQTKAAA
ncbi:MAG TPA: HAD hydrolase-like protein [Noviherbaspirillum sp.]|jgi:beta-phosphoglucomutase-like phosphatase (HAD superfamily)